MNRFPLGIDLNGKTVCLIGNGEQIRQKAQKLLPFGAVLSYPETFTGEDAAMAPALVIVGDTPREEAERIFTLCRRHQIPVNVVDMPELCSFYFPALITCGDLTIAVSSGGVSPAVSSYLRQKIEDMLPDQTERILDWLGQHRERLKQKRILKPAIAAAFSANRPLTEEELGELAEAWSGCTVTRDLPEL